MATVLRFVQERDTQPASPTFTRASVAYKQNGTQVASGVPRYETGKYGSAIMVEEATTNLLTVNQSDGGEDGTTTGWATSGTNTIVSSTEQAWQGTRSIKATYQNDLRLANVAPAIPAAGAHFFTIYVWIPTAWDGGTIRLAHDGTFGASTNLVIVDADLTKRDQWQRISMSLTIDSSDLVGVLIVRAASAPTAGQSIYIDAVQVEAKAYATSWQIGGTARAAEYARVSGSGIISETEGTIEAWFKFNALPSVRVNNLRVLSFRTTADSATSGIVLFASAADRLAVSFGFGGSSTSVTSPTNLTAGVWHHAAVTWGASGVVLYRDGVQVVTSSSVPSGWTATDITIGASSATVPGGQLNGVIDDIRISNRALSATEIADSYNLGVPSPPDGDTTYKLAFDDSLAVPTLYDTLLNLNSETGFTLVRGLSIGVPELRQSWLTQAGVDGAAQYADTLGLAIMQIPILLRKQTSVSALKTLLENLNIELNRSVNIIEYRPHGWPTAYYFDTFRAPLVSLRRGEDIPDPYMMLMDGRAIVLNIPRKPYAGATVTGTRNIIPV